MPLADWFIGGFSDFAYEAWMSSGAADAGFLDARQVAGLFDEHRRGRANHGRPLYALAMFACWWKQRQQDRRAAAPVVERQAAHA